MRRYELSISPNYVSHWGIWEGLRELAQNTIDQHKDKDDYDIYYNSNKEQLTFSNFDTTLDVSTLLLGNSQKTNDDTKIGQFGEGYKLSFLTLIRSGLSIEVKNGSSIWIPKIIKSRRYNSNILVVDIHKGNKNKDLTFIVTGVKPAMYAEFTNNFLTLDYPKHIHTGMGNILTEEKHVGKIFVAGLYVGKVNSNFKYGYDFKPQHIKLDRDRKTLDSFNTAWTASTLLSKTDDCYSGEIFEGIDNKYDDFEYIHKFNYNQNLTAKLKELSHTAFLQQYGVNAIPVNCQEDANLIKQKYNGLVPVIVTKTTHHYITGSGDYLDSNAYKTTTKKKNAPYYIIENFINRNRHLIFGKAKEKLVEEILKKSVEWTHRVDN